MIKNQRPYQLMFSKTHNALLAGMTGVCAKAVGIGVGAVWSFFGKETVDTRNVESVKEELQAIYPKPPSNTVIAAWKTVDENIDLSVIIPAYNAEQYIVQCMDSILNQMTAYTLEVIVVNDRSTDHTLQCLQRYQTDTRVHIVDLKNGGSAAKARNEGLLHARGKYIMFVDSDDCLAPGAVDRLLRKMAETDADVIQGGWQYMKEDGALGLSQRYAERTYTAQYAAERFSLPGTPWGKIYRRALFETIRFPAEYTCFEDAIIHFLVFRKAKSVASCSDIVYYWRKNPNGITQTSQHQKKALQSYWIVEELLRQDETEGLARDTLFAICVIGQLANFCYVNVAGLECELQKKIFTLCCDLYEKTLADRRDPLPYAIRLGAKALRKKRFDLWVKQGRLYSLIR